MTIEELIKEINAGKPTLGLEFDVKVDRLDGIALQLLAQCYKELGKGFTYGDVDHVITYMNFWNFVFNLMTLEKKEKEKSEHKPGTDSQDDTGA